MAIADDYSHPLGIGEIWIGIRRPSTVLHHHPKFGQKPPKTVTIITEQIEVDGPVGRMIAALLLGLGEIELDYRRERQTAGIEVAKKNGVSLRKRGLPKSNRKKPRLFASKA